MSTRSEQFRDAGLTETLHDEANAAQVLRDEILNWEILVNKIREWDRLEHYWAVTDKSLDHKNIRTKESFIKSLMQDYELKKKTNDKNTGA